MNTPPKLSFACPLPWDSMTGDERTRFCSKCHHQIPNLSLVSLQERQRLLEQAKTRQVCGTYYVRLSGELVTPEKPLTEREGKRIKQYGVAALSAAALAVASGCVAPAKQAQVNVKSATEATSASNQEPKKPVASRPIEQSDDEVVLLTGFIICDPQESHKMHGPHAE